MSAITNKLLSHQGILESWIKGNNTIKKKSAILGILTSMPTLPLVFEAYCPISKGWSDTSCNQLIGQENFD